MTGREAAAVHVKKMTKYKLEYIWLDGYTPRRTLRGKTQIKEFERVSRRSSSFRCGASTAARPCRPKGHSSDCVLKPVADFPDPARTNGVLVMCEVMMPDGVTPHSVQQARDHPRRRPAPGSASSRSISSTRTAVRSASRNGYPAPQGPYYTGVGYKNVGDVAAQIVEEHLDICLAAGINHEGINAEVAKGQWEFQIFGKGSKKGRRRDVDGALPARAPDREVRHRHRVSLQAARRHRLERLGHARNFSTKYHARVGGKDYFEALMAAFEKNLHDHIASTARTTTCA
jgi:glutamine synthetase